MMQRQKDQLTEALVTAHRQQAHKARLEEELQTWKDQHAAATYELEERAAKERRADERATQAEREAQDLRTQLQQLQGTLAAQAREAKALEKRLDKTQEQVRAVLLS